MLVRNGCRNARFGWGRHIVHILVCVELIGATTVPV